MVPLTSSTFWGTNTECAAQLPKRPRANIAAEHLNRTPRNIETWKKAHQRRLAGARTADHAERAAARNLERHVVHRVLRTARIGKRDAGKSWI